MEKGRKALLAILIVLAVAAIFKTNLPSHLTLTRLKEYRDIIIIGVENNYLLSVLIYLLAYSISVALSIPGATVLTLAGGFMFGLSGLIYVIIGATIGATAAFLAARYLVGEWVQERYGERLASFNKEVETNGTNYLLTLRLIPLFPFFLINILSGMTKIKLIDFVWTTAIGIIPGSFVYTYAGTQLGNIKIIDDILTKEILIALMLLGGLALSPVLIKKLKKRKDSEL
ncbi:MAG: TVP38/TMEM64 family protein [Nitrospinota bacterium]|nr:TVP38/TMEM64 family protein [Nitrospinota bacterium]